ncbi:hypothetical protein EWM64_g7585 [Hericium alpestre]|uniref:Uncharacterized protein n=1 Tax=Hericium alpestre TaxID=135208 RepID=A0A4Y9ZQT9_9AGAM|nr:hypothetical protein EWM64_g7585 [Hericium alpestre]
MHDIQEVPGFCSVAGLVSSPCSGSLPIKKVCTRSPTIQKKSPDIKTKAYSASVHTSHGLLIPRRTKEKKRPKPSVAPQQPTSSRPKQSGPLKSLDTNLNPADRPPTNPFRTNLEKKAVAIARPTAAPQPHAMPVTPTKRSEPHKASNPFASSTILGDTPIFPRAKVVQPPNPATSAAWRYDPTIGTRPKPLPRKYPSQPESHFRRPAVPQQPQNLSVSFFGRFGQKSRSASQERSRDSMSGFSAPLFSRANTDIPRGSSECLS